MADLPVLPITNYGSLLSSYGEGLANQENATTSNFTAHANATQIPSQIAQTQAQTQNVQAQTTGQDLANQQKQLQLGYYSHLLQNMNAPAANFQGNQPTQAAQDAQADPAATSTADRSNHPYANSDGMPAGDDDMTLDDANLNPEHIKNGAQTQFGVKAVWTPQEYQNLQLAMASGVPGAAEAVQKAHEARLQSQVADAQFAASRAYNSAVTIATAPDGLAFQALQRISPHTEIPQAIDKIAKQKNWDEDEKDTFTRLFATEVGNASHPYSGRDIEVGHDGIARDKQTQQPLLGAAPEGMSASDFATAYRDSTKLVDVPNSDGSVSKLPQWKAAGATSSTQYILAQENGRQLPFAPSSVPRPVLGPNAAPVQGAAPGPQQGAPRQPAQQTQQQPSAPIDPQLSKALADPDFKTQTPPVRQGVTPTPAALEQQTTAVKARTDLLKEGQTATQAASTSLQYLQAAKSILDSKGATLGAYGSLVAAGSKWIPFTGNVDATNYAEISKYLINAGLAQAKGTYGANMTQGEVGLQLNEASPGKNMPEEAIRNLVNTNIASAKYSIDTANRIQKYLASNGDAQQFQTWNQKYFPKSETINGVNAQVNAPVPTATGPNGQKLYLRNGQWVAK